jgi:hypothetical protein
MMLTDLWEQVEQHAPDEATPTWPPVLLSIAQQIARHGTARVAPLEGEPDNQYARRVERLAERFPRLPILPAEEDAYREAIETRSQQSPEFLQAYSKAGHMFQRRIREALEGHVLPGDQVQFAEGPTLHDALRDHLEWLEGEYHDETDGVTDWGRVRIKQAKLLLERHDDNCQ